MKPSIFKVPIEPRNVAPSEESISYFVELVKRHFASRTGKEDEMTPELKTLVEFCNHQRDSLFRYAKDPANAGCKAAGWIVELATPPSTEWAYLRNSLRPLIRRFAMPPRPRGEGLLSCE